MTKILVLYYSMYGHIETMARAVAEGARQVADTQATIKRVPELMPEDVARKSGVKLNQEAPMRWSVRRAASSPAPPPSTAGRRRRSSQRM